MKANATDQRTRSAVMKAPPGVDRANLLARVYYKPTASMLRSDKALAELYTAAANHPNAPNWIKPLAKAVKDLEAS
jgi:hypothetical protein